MLNLGEIKATIEATTTSNILPSRFKHLEPTFNKYIKTHSDTDANLKVKFFLDLEMAKVKAKLTKLKDQVTECDSKYKAELNNFLIGIANGRPMREYLNDETNA